jgi:hypothetical protein
MSEEGRNSPHETAFAASRSDRDRTLIAIHRLESALAMARGAEGWLERVSTDLGALETALRDEQGESNRPDALLSMIAGESPRRFGSRVRHLREQHDDIIRQVNSLRGQLEREDEYGIDPGDLRHRVSWVIQALHHQRARETDLVYEAVERDLGEG